MICDFLKLRKRRRAQRTVHEVEDLDDQIDQREVRAIGGPLDDRHTRAVVRSPAFSEGAAARENGGQCFRLF